MAGTQKVPTVEEIELRAHETRGDGDGIALEDWLAAERELAALLIVGALPTVPSHPH